MANKSWMYAVTLVVACMAITVLSSPASAQKKFLEKVRRKYLLDRKTGKCQLCHHPEKKEDPSKGNLNVYGKAFQEHKDFAPLKDKGDEHKFTKAELDTLLKIATDLEAQDSDGDGVTNKEELELGSFPGDKESKPEEKDLAEFREKAKKKAK